MIKIKMIYLKLGENLGKLLYLYLNLNVFH